MQLSEGTTPQGSWLCGQHGPGAVYSIWTTSLANGGNASRRLCLCPSFFWASPQPLPRILSSWGLWCSWAMSKTAFPNPHELCSGQTREGWLFGNAWNSFSWAWVGTVYLTIADTELTWRRKLVFLSGQNGGPWSLGCFYHQSDASFHCVLGSERRWEAWDSKHSAKWKSASLLKRQSLFQKSAAIRNRIPLIYRKAFLGVSNLNQNPDRLLSRNLQPDYKIYIEMQGIWNRKNNLEKEQNCFLTNTTQFEDLI